VAQEKEAVYKFSRRRKHDQKEIVCDYTQPKEQNEESNESIAIGTNDGKVGS
jgi:hypothetical protein